MGHTLSDALHTAHWHGVVPRSLIDSGTSANLASRACQCVVAIVSANPSPIPD